MPVGRLCYYVRMILADGIKDYYYSCINTLPIDIVFHYYSRLASWQNDPLASIGLDHLKSKTFPNGTDSDGLYAALLSVADSAAQKPVFAAQIRQRYFEKYPQLKALGLALFRVRHWLYIYNVDARTELTKIWPTDEIQKLYNQLLADDQAIIALSTHAINFFYLCQILGLVKDNDSSVLADRLYRLGLQQAANPASATNYVLTLYLFTHCIIADTNFYYRAVTANSIGTYQLMLGDIENLLSKYYDAIKLDAKLEYLVCCRILNKTSALQQRIWQECEQSVSQNGTFLIDTKNTFANISPITPEKSEHRNVLYIMSHSDYPHHPVD